MSFRLDFSKQADKDIAHFKKAGDQAILQKLLTLFQELKEHPLIGTGKPEQLKHELMGYWSRRITKEHRLVYKVYEDAVLILSARGHYQ